MILPSDLKYSKEHTWLRIENEIGIVGITEFAQSELGEIVYVDMPNANNSYKQNEMFGSIEALKTVSDLFMPISGKVLDINKRLLKEPTLVNSDPYNDGWILKIEITAATEMDNLLNAVSYNQLIGN